jgi:hypothetical protein
VQWLRVAHEERIPEHAGSEAQARKPANNWFSFVGRILGVSAAG